MSKVVAKPISRSASSNRKRVTYAEVCYFYPQYTLEEVQALPLRDVSLLLKVARKQEAKKMYELLQIVSAPHTKKGQGVKQLEKYFKGLIDG